MSTMSADGTCNVRARSHLGVDAILNARADVEQLAPMSYFNMVAHNPPTIMISIQASAKNSNGLKGGLPFPLEDGVGLI
jgi:flavin reductase (DIM6/NTAB) family NADH-FMN oxidoreductase RutF